MKICFIAPPPLNLSENNAGTTHVIELANNLSRLGHEVFLFSRGLDKNRIKDIEFNYINAPPIPFKRFEIFFVFPLFTALGMLKYNYKFKFDIIYQRHGSYPGYVLFERLIRKPIITEFNDLPEPEGLEVNRNGLLGQLLGVGLLKVFLKMYRRFLINKTIKYSVAFRVVTKNIKNEVQKKYELEDSKIKIIFNGANTKLFIPLDKLKCREILNIPTNQNIVCFVGTFYSHQGLEYLIESIPKIMGDCENLRLYVIGDAESSAMGTYSKKLFKLSQKLNVSNEVIFTGIVPYKEVPKYISASDICVAPFINERNLKIGLSPLKIFEYGACGKPIVASRIPNLEFIEERKTGILVEPENPDKLAGAIIKLLNNKKLREEMGINGRLYTVNNHSWESVAKKVAQICEEAITKNN